MNYAGQLTHYETDAVDLAVREASPTPWRAEGRTIYDARGNVVAEMRAEDEVQARRDGVAVVALFSHGTAAVEQLDAAEERAYEAEQNAEEAHYDARLAGDDLRTAEAKVATLDAFLDIVTERVMKVTSGPVGWRIECPVCGHTWESEHRTGAGRPTAHPGSTKACPLAGRDLPDATVVEPAA